MKAEFHPEGESLPVQSVRFRPPTNEEISAALDAALNERFANT